MDLLLYTMVVQPIYRLDFSLIPCLTKDWIQAMTNVLKHLFALHALITQMI